MHSSGVAKKSRSLVCAEGQAERGYWAWLKFTLRAASGRAAVTVQHTVVRGTVDWMVEFDLAQPQGVFATHEIASRKASRKFPFIGPSTVQMAPLHRQIPAESNASPVGGPGPILASARLPVGIQGVELGIMGDGETR